MPQNIWPVEQEGQPGRTRNRRTPRTCSTSSRSLRTGPPRRELFLRTGLPSERPGSEVAVVGPCGCDQVAAELVVAAVMEAQLLLPSWPGSPAAPPRTPIVARERYRAPCSPRRERQPQQPAGRTAPDADSSREP